MHTPLYGLSNKKKIVNDWCLYTFIEVKNENKTILSLVQDMYIWSNKLSRMRWLLHW